MSEERTYRLSQVARKLNVGRSTILDFLEAKGHPIDSNPNSKITQELFNMLSKEFADSAMDKEEASGLTIGSTHTDNMVIKSSEGSDSGDDEQILIKDNSTKEGDVERAETSHGASKQAN